MTDDDRIVYPVWVTFAYYGAVVLLALGAVVSLVALYNWLP